MAVADSLHELVLDVTNKCPMRCQHCSANSMPELMKFLPYDEFTGIIDSATSIGCETLSFTGGEPLLHPALPQMVSYAKRVGIRETRLFSSSLILKSGKPVPIPDSLVYGLVKAGLDMVLFNLQGGKEVHEGISKAPGSFDSVVSSARRFKRKGIRVGFHFVPMKNNYMEFELVVSLARSLGLDEVGVLMFVPQGRGLANRESLELAPKQLMQFMSGASRLLPAGDGPELRFGCPFNDFAEATGKQPKACTAAGPMGHVLIDGQVSPCSAFKWDRELHGGNVHETPLPLIFKDGFSEFRKTREELDASYRCTAQLTKAKGRLELPIPYVRPKRLG